MFWRVVLEGPDPLPFITKSGVSTERSTHVLVDSTRTYVLGPTSAAVHPLLERPACIAAPACSPRGLLDV
eukprot:9334669-Pyramimonas_sp.AAC.1